MTWQAILTTFLLGVVVGAAALMGWLLIGWGIGFGL